MEELKENLKHDKWVKDQIGNLNNSNFLAKNYIVDDGEYLLYQEESFGLYENRRVDWRIILLA